MSLNKDEVTLKWDFTWVSSAQGQLAQSAYCCTVFSRGEVEPVWMSINRRADIRHMVQGHELYSDIRNKIVSFFQENEGNEKSHRAE